MIYIANAFALGMLPDGLCIAVKTLPSSQEAGDMMCSDANQHGMKQRGKSKKGISRGELLTRIVEKLRNKHGYKYALTEAVVHDVLWGLREVIIDEMKYRPLPLDEVEKHSVEIPGIVKISAYDGVINLYLSACESFCKRIKRSDKQRSVFYKALLMGNDTKSGGRQ